MRARGLVQPDLRLDPLLQVLEVELVSHRVHRHRLAICVDAHLSGAAIPRQGDEVGGEAKLLHALLVVGGRDPRSGRADQPGRVLRRLDQEAVAVTRVRELIAEAGLRGTHQASWSAP